MSSLVTECCYAKDYLHEIRVQAVVYQPVSVPAFLVTASASAQVQVERMVHGKTLTFQA